MKKPSRQQAWTMYADYRSAHMWTCKLCVCGNDCATLDLINERIATYE